MWNYIYVYTKKTNPRRDSIENPGIMPISVLSTQMVKQKMCGVFVEDVLFGFVLLLLFDNIKRCGQP